MKLQAGAARPAVPMLTPRSEEHTSELQSQHLISSAVFCLLFRSEIVRLKVPALSAQIAAQVVEAVQSLRSLDLRKAPSVAETIDWARALLALNASALTRDVFDSTLTVLLKYESDLQKARQMIRREPRKPKAPDAA